MASGGHLPEMVAQLSLHLSNVRPLLPMYIHLVLSALFPIYTGAHASLSRPSSAAKVEKKTKEDAEDEDEDEEKIQKMEGLSNTDAIVLPVTAGITLAGLYFLIMTYGADIINLVMGWYFSAVGVFSVTQLVNDAATVAVEFVYPSYYAYKGSLWKVDASKFRAVRQDTNDEISDLPTYPGFSILPMPQFVKNSSWKIRRGLKDKYRMKVYMQSVLDVCINVTIINVLSAVFGLGTIIYVNAVSRPWFLTNLQGFAVSYSALQLLSPTTFSTGSLILGALFFYDIWAVFFTPLMVGVAKNLDQPIKLVFPRPDEPSPTAGEPPIKTFSMLGLGDIVVPGIMLGLALRFDLYMFYLRKQRKATKVSIDSSTGEATSKEVTEKAPYVAVTGHWGDRLWTRGLPETVLPVRLKSSFPKPYFTASMIGYVAGMIATLIVMSIFHHAQPALLYLVPGVLVSLWGTALVRGELTEMWEFTEAANADQIEQDGSLEQKKDAETGADNERSHKGLFERLWHDVWSSKAKEEEVKQPGGELRDKTQATEPRKDVKRSPVTKDAGPQDDLLLSFSIARIDQMTPLSPKIEDNEPKDPIEGSESSEDAVVVSSADLDGASQSVSTPRYRMRSGNATVEDSV